MPRLRKPRALRAGATVAIVAPGGAVDPGRVEAGEALVRAAGFEPVRRADLTARRGYLAGDDTRRAAELMEWWSDPRADALWCARGGYGCDRILHRLDAGKVRDAAKPLVGYSDVTALLLWQRRCAGLVGFHGPMLDRGADVHGEAVQSLVELLTGEIPPPLRGEAGGGGSAEGRLVGGSLTLVASSIGTPWEIDTRGGILLLEDTTELPYRIDRMLQQLRGAGKLDAAVGFGIGDFASCSDERYPELPVETVLEEALTPFGKPLVTGLRFGHVPDNFPWPVGCRATIDGERGIVALRERGVSAAR